MPPKGKSTAATMAMRQQQQQQLQQQQQMALLHSPRNMASDGAASEAASSAAIGKLSPLGFGKARDAKSLQEAEREARKKAAAEEMARREAEAAEAERIAAEEAAAAERAAEEERIRRLPPPRPVTPPFQPLELPALTFMWLRDRVPSVSGNVQPSSDKKHVLIPAAMTEQLFYGRLVLAAIHGYLPRSDEVRTSQRAINHAAGVSVPPTSVTPPLTQSSSHPLTLPASMVTPKKGGGGGSSSLSSFANSAIAAIDPNWTAPERLAQRLEAWGLVRGHCKTLGLEMSDALVTEIADHCDHDSLMSFVEGLHQCLKRYDIARREYSKALVAEARAGNRTRAEELHKEPPPPQVALIAKKQVPHVVLDGVKGGRRDTSPTIATSSASASAAPPAHDVDSSSPPTVSEGTAPGALRSDRTPTMPCSRATDAAASSPSPRRSSSGVDASCQTEGRCIIIMPGDYRDAYVQSVPDVVPADPPRRRESDGDAARGAAAPVVGAFVTSGVAELVHSEPASPMTTAPGENVQIAEAVVANDSETPEPTAPEAPPPATEAAPDSSATVVVAEEAPTVSEVPSDDTKAVEAVSSEPISTTAAAADADAPVDDGRPAAPSLDAVDENVVTPATTSEVPGSEDAAPKSAPEAAPPTTSEEEPSPS